MGNLNSGRSYLIIAVCQRPATFDSFTYMGSFFSLLQPKSVRVGQIDTISYFHHLVVVTYDLCTVTVDQDFYCQQSALFGFWPQPKNNDEINC